jgi:uncharacterized protein (TIGR03084 family)
MDAICDDLQAETDALVAVVAGLSEEQWHLPTPAEGWDSHETIIHLGMADYAARVAAVDADEFGTLKQAMMSGEFDLHRASGADVHAMSGHDLLVWFKSERAQMMAAFRARGPKDRLPWFGPDMSTLSSATARMMETWSHGSDVASTFGVEWTATDRLRHVAHIGVATRGWSYANRGLEVPPGTVRVELTAPSGEEWTWGPEDADATVRGTALDFCLLVTQRRHRSEVALSAEGELADGWLNIAQAFAGPATDTRSAVS